MYVRDYGRSICELGGKRGQIYRRIVLRVCNSSMEPFLGGLLVLVTVLYVSGRIQPIRFRGIHFSSNALSKMYLVLCLLTVCLGVVFLYRRKTGGTKPPGPPPLPVIGNLLDVPKKAEGHAYSLMADKYGKFVMPTQLHTTLHLVYR